MNIDLASIGAWFVGLTRPDPARDWLIAASLATIVALGGVGLAAYLFWGIQTGTIVAASQEVPRSPIPVSRESIKKVLEAYQERAINYTSRNFVVVDLIDPRPPTKKK